MFWAPPNRPDLRARNATNETTQTQLVNSEYDFFYYNCSQCYSNVVDL